MEMQTLSRLVKCFFKNDNERLLSPVYKIVEEIENLSPTYKAFSDEQLREKTTEFKQYIASGTPLDDLLIPAFATVREMSSRVLGLRHFPMQLVGGIILHKGMISEMKTGEGKTLVATLPAYLNALTGDGIHIVTVNDYLAKRDSAWMGKLFEALGLTTTYITGDISEENRAAAYKMDIVYATNNELGFDYLKDNMKFARESALQCKLNYAIIDEIDSILIDESRTPLVISGPVNENINLYNVINNLIPTIDKEFIDIEEKNRTSNLNEKGIEHIEQMLRLKGLIQQNSSLYDIENISIIHHLNQAIKSHYLFFKDKDYIVKDGKVLLIDEFTGRMMGGRRFSDGLHQALEAKEKVKIQQENQTLASITFQNYFRLYKKLSGMTGTAVTEAEEFRAIYNLGVVQIPTNIPVRRVDEDDEIYCTEQEKRNAIIKLIKECNERSQPVLVGTTSIEKSEQLSAILKKEQLKHSVLNARYHEQEAQIIAQAGKPGGITIATNMAGRGTDIKLGGYCADSDTPEQQDLEAMAIVKEAGGLYVVGTERHESRRIDNQLRGRAGRQGDPGRSKFFLSLEDDLMRIFGSEKISSVLKKLGIEKDEAIHHPWITKAIERAQKKVEVRNYDIRKTLLRFDDVMNEQRNVLFRQRNEIIDNNDIDLKSVMENVHNRIVQNAGNVSEAVALEFHKLYNLDTVFDPKLTATEIKNKIDDIIEKEISEKSKILPTDILNSAKKRIMLVTLDHLWREHLHALDHVKRGINLRAIAQRDPLSEYKREAFFLFQSMLQQWEDLVISHFIRITVS